MRLLLTRGCSDSSSHDEFLSKQGDNKPRDSGKRNWLHMHEKMFVVCVDIILDNMIQRCRTYVSPAPGHEIHKVQKRKHRADVLMFYL